MSRHWIAPALDTSTSRISEPSNVSQYATLRSVPTVSTCPSSGRYCTPINRLLAMMICFRENVVRSQMMQLPSRLDDTASSSFFDSMIEVISPACSETRPISSAPRSSTCHIRICESAPPVTKRVPQLVVTMTLTPPPDASYCSHFSLPVSGRKARTVPSSQPDSSSVPLTLNATALHTWPGTEICRRGFELGVCQMVMSDPAHVAKSSDAPAGNITSLTWPCEHADRSSAAKSAYVTRCTEHLSVPTYSSCPSPRSPIDVTAPSTWSFRTTFHESGLTSATVPEPEPTSSSPFLSTESAHAPFWNLARSGPTFFSSWDWRSNCMTSPVVVAAYAATSSWSTWIAVTSRMTPRVTTSFGAAFPVTGLMLHTRRWLFPPTTKTSSVRLANAQHVAFPPRPFEVPLLKRGFPVAVSHTVSVPSAGPPSDTRYLSDGDHAMHWIAFLCSVSRLISVLVAKSHRMMVASKADTSPEATSFPLFEIAMHVTFPVCPWRNFCPRFSPISSTMTEDPSG
mmetsp:Transcript_3663/g.11490  ORF Transcript_3663/g.11490 Transcript_3663/m.11490 type:complete len:512 (+) Transcript_3663:367-1902(+)